MTSGGVQSEQRLGPFSVGGQNYALLLRTRQVQPGSTNESGPTVVSMEIQDATGAVQYRRTFPYQEADKEFSDAWSVSAAVLAGTKESGLLVTYSFDSEPSAPVEEPGVWFQVFGVVNGKFAAFGAPVSIQGGLLNEYVDGNTYKAARPLGPEADALEFRLWAGHCRLIFPLRIDWARAKLTPAQECTRNAAGVLNAECQYKIVPESELARSDMTFVRLSPNYGETSRNFENTVVKKDSKVELLAAMTNVQWHAGAVSGTSAVPKNPMNDADDVNVAPDSDLWLKVRIDGKTGWIHTEEDFQALGLPEDQ